MEPNGIIPASESPICDECGNTFVQGSSSMASLCCECSHILYGYSSCAHRFEAGRCQTCGWDGSRSEYIQSRLKGA